jgi:hypothetical protein
MKTRLITLWMVILGTTMVALPAHAQRRGAGGRIAGARRGFVRTRGAGGGGYFAGAAFDPYDYSDYTYDSSAPGPEEVQAPPPQIIFAQAAPPTAAPSANAHQSVVLELQGDHWVRIMNYGQSQSDGQTSTTGSEQTPNTPKAHEANPTTPRRTEAEATPVVIPAAMLVYRDGHQEEIGKYAIIRATIYTNGDYWSSGSWTRQIQIAELDVPATLKVNQERGANFSLPSGPNEVMIRP